MTFPSFHRVFFRPSHRAGAALLLAGAALLLSLSPAARAADSVDTPWFKVQADGMFTVSQVPFGVVVYNPSYLIDRQGSAVIDLGYPKTSAGKSGPVWKLQGVWQPKWGGTATKFTETIERLGEKSLRVAYTFESADGAALNVPRLLGFQFELPAEKAAGKTVLVNGAGVKLADALSYDNWGPHEMTVPLPEGRLTIRGDLKIRIQDDRPWNNDFFKTWLVIAQAPYASATASLELEFDYEPGA